jgi:hypothetical protein
MHCTIINSGYICSLSKHVASNFQTSNDVSLEKSVNVVSDKGELPESVSPIHSIDKLEGIYGNVYSNDTLLLSFYAEKPMNDQSVADYGMQLESKLQKG